MISYVCIFSGLNEVIWSQEVTHIKLQFCYKNWTKIDKNTVRAQLFKREQLHIEFKLNAIIMKMNAQLYQI